MNEQMTTVRFIYIHEQNSVIPFEKWAVRVNSVENNFGTSRIGLTKSTFCAEKKIIRSK